ncbi:hypothetical protein SCAPIOD90019 [Staphylococcus capitis]|nr:hypothetical protein SCAPIOD90019 [Staphylococcus capitis]CRN10411.1 hypothetical protein BN151710350 [Staphylococcus capitis]
MAIVQKEVERTTSNVT